MPAKLVLLREFATEVEAQLAQSALEREGIESFLTNISTATALSYVGVATGGVRLSVDSDQHDRAREILRNDIPENFDASDWYCGDCREPQDGRFEVCWKCGKERASVETRESDADDIAEEVEPVDSEILLLEKSVTRAWRSAIFGLFILQGILHLYSMYLLMDVFLAGRKLSRPIIWKFWGAAAIDLMALFIIYYLLVLR